MPRKRLDINWIREIKTEDLKPALKRYRRYLEDIGHRESTIESYVFRVGKYLEFAQTDAPLLEDFTKFRDSFMMRDCHEVRSITIVSPSRVIIRCAGSP